MPGSARRRIVDLSRVQVLHCWTRCVRRSYLCGRDPVDGQDYGHRRDWIQELLAELAGLFALEVGFYCIMKNHLHLVLRSRPELARRWPRDKIVRCWLKVAKLKRGTAPSDWEPSEERVAAELKDPKRVKRLRRRLANVSWFMGALAENVSRRANIEDKCTGHFWEQRFKSRNLAESNEVLVAGVYVDLNPIRAGETLTPEQSQYTSAHDRIAGHQQRMADQGQSDLIFNPRRPDRWLCELTIREKDAVDDASRHGGRASDLGLLPIMLADYLELLDWSGRLLHGGKRGAIPTNLPPILDRLELTQDEWFDRVADYHLGSSKPVGA